MPSAVLACWGAALFLALPLNAEEPLVAKAYEEFYNLQYDRAIADFTRLIAEESQDPAAYNHLAQAILYRDMFRAGALETELVTGNNPFLRRPKVNASPEDQRRFDECIGTAIRLSGDRLARNPRDIGALYARGVSYGLRANYNFLVRKAWRDALRDATSARKDHNAVTEIDPSFIDARMVQGLHDYLVGSLPFTWRVLGFLVGFRGDKEQGIRTVEMVAAKGNINKIDAEILLCAIYRREKEPARAIPLLKSLIARFPRNYLLPMELAQMYSDMGEKDKALAVLDNLEKLKQSGDAGLSGLKREKLLFAKGNIRFWYNDLDDALADMRAATRAAEDLDLNTGVLAWMRLGQIYDLKGQRAAAVEAYRRAIAFAPDSDAAKESRGYISNPYHRKRKAS
jgi:tetratricopeptide (TPR) repeat protein